MNSLLLAGILTLSTNGTLTLPESEAPNGAIVWSSTNGIHFERGHAFTNSTQIQHSGPVGIIKAEIRSGPAALTIIDLRGTIVFQSSKVLTNIIATNALRTFQGQVEFRSFDTNGVSYSQGRFETMPNAGSVTVVATDCDGFITTTNVTVINAPVEYETPRSPSLKRSAASGFAPAADGDREGDYWVTAHQVTRLYRTDDKFGRWVEKTINGRAGLNGARYQTTYRRAGPGIVWADEGATYSSTTNWTMRLTTNYGGWAQPVKSYPDVREISSYNDTRITAPTTTVAERFLQTVSCSVSVYTGSNGITFNNWCKLDYQFFELEGREGDELGGFKPVSTPAGTTIGSTGRAPGDFIPCLDNSILDVTPNVPALGRMLRFEVKNFRRH